MAPDGDVLADDPDLLHELGVERIGQGRFDEALACFEQALRLRPDSAGTCNNLGLVLLHLGQCEEAVFRFRQAVSLQPDLAQAHNNLGLVLLHLGRCEEAVDSLRQAMHLMPELAQAHNNLGLAFWRLGRQDEARDSFWQAVHLQPDLAEAQNNLGTTLAARGLPDEALACYERAVQLEPGHAEALTNLGNAYKDQGRLAEAVATYRAAVAKRPDDPKIHSNLLLALHYQAGIDPIEILAESRRFAERHAPPPGGLTPTVTSLPLEGRRLRVGYVSPDFREHPVAFFLEPILASHDRRRFEIFCYANVSRPDEVTERLRRCADHWRSLVGLSDAQVADVIRGDDIDVLVDLAGHTGGNRLGAFARKPAAVQASYLGYLGTTGLPAMDYYITDAHADPPGSAEVYYQEELIHLPECAFCYAPGPAPSPSEEPPAERSGRVTFGCLNNLAKASEEVLGVWSRVLAAVPGSWLGLPAGAGRAATERVRETLARYGIAPERLLFAGSTATRFDYLELYHAIDIALDPFPYNGVTTTCDALWMGVPVISLAGRMGASRQGVRFLRSVGLGEFVAETPEEYARIAAELAGDLSRPATLRSTLRERMSRSPLMDARRLTRDLEAAYHTMWAKALASGDRITSVNPSM
jgi:predicted O-linked N-acetylglucosamine transferase (SPINDLY family)